MKGLLIILSSPSGGGKTTIIREILKQNPDEFVYSISATTRKPRSGEIDGQHYFFLTPAEFMNLRDNGLLLEWEPVHDYYYGTPKLYIEKSIDQGKLVLLDIDVNGALRVAENYRENTITIFIAPPSMDELIQRLKNRKTDSDPEINRRLERIPLEMEKSKLFDYVVVNQDLKNTVVKVMRIIREFQVKKAVGQTNPLSAAHQSDKSLL